jgi:short subunit dehydrogenase-like uncharacterized protein
VFLDLQVAELSDLSALTVLVAQTTVVITTVGPYLQFGGLLVAACMAAGTHYVDLAGEAPFVRATMEQHHAAAQAKGVKIVHCCGECPPQAIYIYMYLCIYKCALLIWRGSEQCSH